MHSLNCTTKFVAADRHAVKLLKLLGPTAFQALQDEFGGKRVWVPKAGARYPCAGCRKRRSCAKRWSATGHSPAAIAKHLRVSVKTVYRLLGGLRGQEGSRRDAPPVNGRIII